LTSFADPDSESGSGQESKNDTEKEKKFNVLKGWRHRVKLIEINKY
jgi:hypothetical protein